MMHGMHALMQCERPSVSMNTSLRRPRSSRPNRAERLRPSSKTRFARRSPGAGAFENQTVRLKTVKGSGVRPGVDLDDSASLLELMES